MIRIKNIVAQGGYSYSKYLKKQLAEIMENSIAHKEYNMSDILQPDKLNGLENSIKLDKSNTLILDDGRIVPIANLQKYTRITGDLFDRWGLTEQTYLTDAKIDQVCALELGEDERTAGQIKPVLRNYKTVMGADGYPIEVHKKDIERGHYVDQYGEKIKFAQKDVKTKSGFKKKTAIELVFSMDQSFSHASALMNDEEKTKVAKLWLDCAEATYKECFREYLQTYHGQKGETGASLYFHNDNRNGDSHDHVHLNISNIVRLENGTVMSIEIPALRQKNFHQSMDAMFKSMYVEKWQEQFGGKYPVEAYDKERQIIKSDDKFQMQHIENYRIAFTDEILETIRQRSKSKELIDKAISQQKRDEYERAELKRMTIQDQFNELEKKIKGIELPTNYGVIVSHGAAPYNNDIKESMSYFVELELKNGKSKKIWSKDLENAINEKSLKNGDFAGFSQTGEKSIKVKDKDGKWIEAIKKTWEGLDLSNHKIEMGNLADLDARMKAINKAHEQSIKIIESSKNRDAIWLTIKQKKKAIGKELKDVELHKDAVQVGSSIKNEQSRGALYVIRDDEALLDKLTNTNPYFTKFDLIVEISKISAVGSKAAKLAENKLKEWNDNGLLVSKQTDPKFPAMYTTKKLAKQEFSNVQIAKKLVLNKGFSGVADYRQAVVNVIKKQSKDRRFNSLQIDLMKAVIEPNGSRMVLCEGFPGTGKSTVMGGAIEIMQKQSATHCLVLAPTGKVAASAGADTTANHTGTIDQWLIGMDAGKIDIVNNSVIFIDEAGMIGTKNYNKFLTHINKAVKNGIDVKVVLIGDTNQIQSVQAGNTYTNIVKDNQHDVHYLRKIIRQKDNISLQIAKITSLSEVDAAKMSIVKKSGIHVEQSWKMIEESGRLLEFDTTTQKNEAIAERYLSDNNKTIEKVILCATNEDVKVLNELIQEKRISNGELGGQSISNSDENFYVGDRVMVNKNSKEYKNGDFGIISKINSDGSFNVEFGEGKDSKIKKMKDVNKIALANAISIHKSQGLTVNSVILNATNSPVVDQELWNVAQTRARYITHTAVVKADKSKVLDAFKRENSKVNLLELGIAIDGQDKIAALAKLQVATQAVLPKQVKEINKTIDATKTATAVMQSNTQADTPIAERQPIKNILLAHLRTKLKSFGKTCNSTFKPHKPPVAIIKQKQAEIAAKQFQSQQQAKMAQLAVTQQVGVRQAEIAQKQQTLLKRKKNIALKI